MHNGDESKIIIYGRSIGTGIATHLAKNNNPGTLILESPHYNFTDLVLRILKQIGIPIWVGKLHTSFLVRYKFPNNENIQEVKLYYFGTAAPSVYGIKYEQLSEEEFIRPGKDVYAISVHKLEKVKWTKEYEPSGRAGYSIFIYDFTEK